MAKDIQDYAAELTDCVEALRRIAYGDVHHPGSDWAERDFAEAFLEAFRAGTSEKFLEDNKVS
jgi:hypothetical protein